jgi:hypothetical protein
VLALLGESLVKIDGSHFLARRLQKFVAARTPCGEPVEALSLSAALFPISIVVPQRKLEHRGELLAIS